MQPQSILIDRQDLYLGDGLSGAARIDKLYFASAPRNDAGIDQASDLGPTTGENTKNCRGEKKDAGPAPPSPDIIRSMILLRERLDLVADRLSRQNNVFNAAKLEGFGYVDDLEERDGADYEETVNGRLSWVEHELDRLENVTTNFGSTI